ncbi:MAG: alpha/beta fold hydrolase [Thermomicrobiales bacterium]
MRESSVIQPHLAFIDAGAARIHVATWPGPATCAPLVLLHGIWDTWATFAQVAPQFAADRAVYALDLRGHGQSDKPATGYQTGDYAADVLGVFAALSLAPPVLLGFSLGALVAAHLAATHPEYLSRLILEDPPYCPDADPRGRAAWLRTLLDLKRQPFEDVVEGLAELNPTRDRATNELSARALLVTADGPFQALLDEVNTPSELPGQLARVTASALVLRADPACGGALSDVGYAAVRAALPAASYVEFPGSGHLIHAEREHDFVAAVRAFLATG